MIDQRKLPKEEVYLECRDYEAVARAIEKMAIRGAPAIGVAAAYGVALGILRVEKKEGLGKKLEKILCRFEATRPTARNLFWALERMRDVYEGNKDLNLAKIKKSLVREAQAIEKEDIETNKKIGFFGKELIRDGDTILTHCNAGELATAGYGTALGIIRAAFRQGKLIEVYVGETRPYLQGARLTCWELEKQRIPIVLITDNMAGWLMQMGEINLVITGADRIARNGDTANKIGTYSLAILAKEHGLPFYVAAPMNTIDFDLAKGSEIPIEERGPEEVRKIGNLCLTLPQVKVRNPAFDLTPAKYIQAIITEKGIARPPYERSLKELRKKEDKPKRPG